jgi:chemotaxis protein histidine kinase CheA
LSDPGAELSDTYVGWTQQALERFKELLAGREQADTDIDKLRQDLHRIAHDIKGMGGSFGFPLMSDFGTSLCLYLRSLPDGTPLVVEIIEAHLEAMDAILKDGTKGAGGEDEQALVATLAQMVNDVVGEPAAD